MSWIDNLKKMRFNLSRTLEFSKLDKTHGIVLSNINSGKRKFLAPEKVKKWIICQLSRFLLLKEPISSSVVNTMITAIFEASQHSNELIQSDKISYMYCRLQWNSVSRVTDKCMSFVFRGAKWIIWMDSGV